jgi:hypothetical protein
MPDQLRCRDLKPGDVMLKASDGSLISAAIRIGQAVTGQVNPGVVHAGLMFDNNFIIEAQGAGISANDLRVQNVGYGYWVYRCRNENMAAGAGTCAKMMFDIHQRTGAMAYTVPGAIGSLFGRAGTPKKAEEMDALLDRILEGKRQPFFCSQFVVYVYQFVAEQNGTAARATFTSADGKVAPSYLAAELQSHWLFDEVGYLMPGER